MLYFKGGVIVQLAISAAKSASVVILTIEVELQTKVK